METCHVIKGNGHDDLLGLHLELYNCLKLGNMLCANGNPIAVNCMAVIYKHVT